MTEKENDMCGDFPIKQDVTVLKSEGARSLKPEFICYEIPFGKTEDEYFKETLSEEEFAKWEYDHSPNRLSDIDEADWYRGASGREVKDVGACGYTCLDILQDLYGQPWNNLSLNYVLAFKPTSIRVTAGFVNLDARTGRVTVHLEEDNRTISSIGMEMAIGHYGSVSGGLMDMALQYQKKHGSLDDYEHHRGPVVVVNDRSVKRVDISVPELSKDDDLEE